MIVWLLFHLRCGSGITKLGTVATLQRTPVTQHPRNRAVNAHPWLNDREKLWMKEKLKSFGEPMSEYAIALSQAS